MASRPHIPQLWRYTGQFEKVLRNLDVIVAPSRFLQEKLEEKHRGIRVVRIPFFAPTSPGECSMPLNERPCSEPYFFFSGKLEPYKGLMVLTEAFRRYCVGTGTKLVISGRGPLTTWLLDYIKRHKLEKHIIYLGGLKRDAYLSALHNALAVIVPSYSDAFPSVPLEALSLGTPVIGSRTGGIIDIIEDLDESLMFTPGDPDHLGEILNSFNPARFPREQVQALYERKFSINKHYQQYMRLISLFW